MCGIAMYWAREADISVEGYMMMVEWAEKRGQNGFGVAVFDPQTKSWSRYKQTLPMSEDRNSLEVFLAEHTGIGKITLISCRATPETEPQTDLDMLQPIINEDERLALVHNGSVTDSVITHMKQEYAGYKWKTNIDSEGILASYFLHHKNMVSTMEFLSGAFAFVLLDYMKRSMYLVTSFNPLAHMYIKGYGYFAHSDNDCLTEILEGLTGAKKDGMNVWESWYHHYLEGYTIIETDLDSGSQFKQTFKPRFLHTNWNALEPVPEEPKEAVLVAASGGIDSGLTTHLLKLAGYDVEMVHFDYGHRGADSEGWAVEKLNEKLEVPLNVIDLAHLYNDHIPDVHSMLLNEQAPIESGGINIKSTIAWVAGRNAIFSAILMGMAEGMVLSMPYDKVYISAGWAQLSEETGGYPDNSFQFAQALNNLKDFGYITGSHHIEFLPVLSRLTKTECWTLGDAFGFPFECTVSCDNPIMWKGTPALCLGCGSTRLSRWASDRAHINDPRIFYKEKSELEAGIIYRIYEGTRGERKDITPLIKRLVMSEKGKGRLIRVYNRRRFGRDADDRGSALGRLSQS
jgi:7-cyano-7-deazaguanine synthase in queuosine biosynthesis